MPGRLVKRSTKVIDLDSIDARYKVRDLTVRKPILRVTDYAIKAGRIEKEPGLVARSVAAVVAPVKAVWNWMVGK